MPLLEAKHDLKAKSWICKMSVRLRDSSQTYLSLWLSQSHYMKVTWWDISICSTHNSMCVFSQFDQKKVFTTNIYSFLSFILINFYLVRMLQCTESLILYSPLPWNSSILPYLREKFPRTGPLNSFSCNYIFNLWCNKLRKLLLNP